MQSGGCASAAVASELKSFKLPLVDVSKPEGQLADGRMIPKATGKAQFGLSLLLPVGVATA